MQPRRISLAVMLGVLALAGVPRWPVDAPAGEVVAPGPGELSRGFVSEARACKPAAPIEITLVTARTEGDGSVTLEWNVAARAALVDAHWTVQLPEGARWIEGPLAGRLDAELTEQVQLRVRLPEALDGAPACVLVAEAGLGHDPGERVIARQALHRPTGAAVVSASRPAPIRSAPAFVPSRHRAGN